MSRPSPLRILYVVHKPWSAFWQILAEIGTGPDLQFVVVDFCRGDPYRVRRDHETVSTEGLPSCRYIVAEHPEADAMLREEEIHGAVVPWIENRIHYWRESPFWLQLKGWLDAHGWPSVVLDYAGASKWHPEAGELWPSLVLRPFNLEMGKGARFARLSPSSATSGKFFQRSRHGGGWRIFVGPPQVERDALAYFENLLLMRRLAQCEEWIEEVVLFDIDEKQVRQAQACLSCRVSTVSRTLPWSRLADVLGRTDLFITTNPQTFLSRRAMAHGSLVLFLRPPASAFWWDPQKPLPLTLGAIESHLPGGTLAEVKQYLDQGGSPLIDHTLLSGAWWSILEEESVLQFCDLLGNETGGGTLREILGRGAGFERFLAQAEERVAERLLTTPDLADRCREIFAP